VTHTVTVTICGYKHLSRVTVHTVQLKYLYVNLELETAMLSILRQLIKEEQKQAFIVK